MHVCIVFMKLVIEIEHICNNACIARTGISGAYIEKYVEMREKLVVES